VPKRDGTEIKMWRKNVNHSRGDNKMKAAVLSAFIAILLATAALGSPAKTPAEAFDHYKKAVVDGRYADAENCWAASTIDASKHLGITYDDIQAKYDCASALISLLPDIRKGQITVSVDTVIDNGDYSKIMVSLYSVSDTTACRYFAVQSDSGWQLISPLQVLTAGWKIRETYFAKLYYTDSTRDREKTRTNR
jgi:hypothetical protein